MSEPAIAVTHQDRRTVTSHAGRCRHYLLFDAHGQPLGAVDLPMDQVLHEGTPQAGHPLHGLRALITAGAGPGLRQRLGAHGTEVWLTTETDPAQAVARYLAGEPAAAPVDDDHHGCGSEGHHHHHHHHGG